MMHRIHFKFLWLAVFCAISPSCSIKLYPDQPGVPPTSTTEEVTLDRPEVSSLSTLQRISERLSVLQALDEQQLRRLEMLEYKLTRLEAQAQERSEGFRSELKEASRRMQQVDWSVNKMDANLEGVKIETAGLRQGQESIRNQQSREPGTTEDEGKLRMISTTLSGIRGSLASLGRSYSAIATNLSLVANKTKAISTSQHQLVSKQHLTATLHELRPSPAPICPPRRPLKDLPVDCWDVQKGGATRSGVYRIQPERSPEAFYVQCQLEEQGGGWTVIQHRNDGMVDFFRGWQDYKHGFGNLAGEFWLGLQKIHLLTDSKVQELLIEMQDFDKASVYARYSSFAVGTEIQGYPITMLGSYQGDAGDSLSHHAGHRFSTRDLDADQWEDGNCAETHLGAWWYVSCENANLNGRYFDSGQLPQEYEYQGIYWHDWHGPSYSLRTVRMSVRPQQELPGKTTTEKKNT